MAPSAVVLLLKHHLLNLALKPQWWQLEKDFSVYMPQASNQSYRQSSQSITRLARWYIKWFIVKKFIWNPNFKTD